MAGPFQVVVARLTPDTPVCGVPLEPYVLARRADTSTVTGGDLPAEGATDARFSIKYRWYRSVVTKSGQVCWAHSDREATVQCILCLRSRVDIRKSYHCSPECMREHWHFHREFHRGGRGENGAGGGEPPRAPTPAPHGGEAWLEVGCSPIYTPCFEDVGSFLKLECVAHDAAAPYHDLGKVVTTLTPRVRPEPTPPRRGMVPMPPSRPVLRRGGFTLLTYNLLAELYAAPEAFPHCPAWALAWPYRAPNLLRELLAHDADVLCLQEVQSDAFAGFWQPELARAGYAAIFKKKTAEMFSKNSYVTDGCATFFKKDRFALVKKYEVEFNKAALSLADSFPPDQKKLALSRLLKDNVALIAVLEALDVPGGGAEGGEGPSAGPGTGTGTGTGAANAAGAAPADAALATPGTAPRRQLVCVANTHIHSNPELSDVKLWQVHTLLKGLEKIAASADIPMLLAGDFNTLPGSAAHALLVSGGVPPHHPELSNDPLGILRPAAKLQHGLPLASAYAALAVPGEADSAGLVRQRRRLDLATAEPRWTNLTGNFKGTLDYILYTSDSLVPVATLELMEESEVRGGGADGGLPSEFLSSDHLALAVTFQYAAVEGAK
ncbi:hypothetical protein ACKKBF_B34205 [Auxenochlorella protothecoides x Auxenochlorella symbiontica]